MPMQHRRLKIGFHILAIVLLGTLATRPGFAENAASGAHGDSKADALSGEASGSRSPSGGDAGGGATRPDVHAPHGDDGKNREGAPPAGNEAVKDVNSSAPVGKDAGAIDTNIAPSRRLDKKPNKIGEGRTTIDSIATRNLHRRMLSAPQSPSHPVRNSIGVPVPASQGVDRHDSLHPGSLAAPHISPGGTTVIPGSVGSRFTKTESGVGHHVPNTNPIVLSPVPNRGAISGTGLTHHNSGPSQIGGPRASVAGINGTTIRPKH
jgi:hypothetical protein